jgi:hypothetical protein
MPQHGEVGAFAPMPTPTLAAPAPAPSKKPRESLSDLIYMAIKTSERSMLTLAEIYKCILDRFPYFRTAGDGWKNSIRHTLTSQKCFVNMKRSAADGSGKGGFWVVHPLGRKATKRTRTKSGANKYRPPTAASGRPGFSPGAAAMQPTNQLQYIKDSLIKNLKKHKYSWPFKKPVDAIGLGLTTYFDIIKKPMSIDVVEDNLKKTPCKYKTGAEALADLTLMFTNCYQYNREDDDIFIMAKDLDNYMTSQLLHLPTPETSGRDSDISVKDVDNMPLPPTPPRDTSANLPPVAASPTVEPPPTLVNIEQIDKTLPVPGTWRVEIKQQRGVYFALDNETPQQIARKFGYGLKQVLRDNKRLYPGLIRTSKLYVGTTIVLPVLAGDEVRVTQGAGARRDDEALPAATAGSVHPSSANTAGTCKCGSADHTYTTHKDCPLKKLGTVIGGQGRFCVSTGAKGAPHFLDGTSIEQMVAWAGSNPYDSVASINRYVGVVPNHEDG